VEADLASADNVIFGYAEGSAEGESDRDGRFGLRSDCDNSSFILNISSVFLRNSFCVRYEMIPLSDLASFPFSTTSLVFLSNQPRIHWFSWFHRNLHCSL
jgi:hypothetical protein